MFFEFQLSADVFTWLVRNRLRGLRVCAGQPFTFSENGQNVEAVLGNVEFTNTTYLQRERVENAPSPQSLVQVFTDGATQDVWVLSPQNYTSFKAPYLQVRQEVKLHFVKANDLEANGVKPTAAFRTLTINAAINVALTATNATQGGGPVTLRYSFAHLDWGSAAFIISPAVREELATKLRATPLEPSTLDLGSMTELMSREIRAVNAGITCDAAGSFVAMRVDFEIYTTPPTINERFFATPRSVLAGRDWAMLVDSKVITQGLETRAASAMLTASNKVRRRSGPNAIWEPHRPGVRVEAEVELVDACPFFVDNIDLDVDLAIEVDLSVPLPGVLRRKMSLSAHPSDFAEEVACAATTALLWPFLGPVLLKDESTHKGIGAYLGGLALGPTVLFLGILGYMEFASVTRDVSKELGASCRKVDDHYECDDPVAPRMRLNPPTTQTLRLLQVYGVPEGLVYAGEVENRAELPARETSVQTSKMAWRVAGNCKSAFSIVCEAQIEVEANYDNPICAFEMISGWEPFLAWQDGNHVIVRPRGKPGTLNTGTRCGVRVVTPAGVRTISYSNPGPISDAEQSRLEKLKAGSERFCDIVAGAITMPQDLFPTRPPPEERWVEHFQLVVQGLASDARLLVLGDDRKTLMTARPNDAGEAHLTLLLPSGEKATSLEIVIDGARLGPRSAARISGLATQLARRATIELSGTLRSMQFEGRGRLQQLRVQTDTQEVNWDLSTPAAPGLLSSIYHSNGSQENGHDSARALHTGKGVRYMELSETLKSLLGSRRDTDDAPLALGTPKVGGLARAVYVRTAKQAKIIDVADDGSTRDAQQFLTPAWCEGTSLGGSLLARHDAQRNVVEIFSTIAKKHI